MFARESMQTIPLLEVLVFPIQSPGTWRQELTHLQPQRQHENTNDLIISPVK